MASKVHQFAKLPSHTLHYFGFQQLQFNKISKNILCGHISNFGLIVFIRFLPLSSFFISSSCQQLLSSFQTTSQHILFNLLSTNFQVISKFPASPQQVLSKFLASSQQVFSKLSASYQQVISKLSASYQKVLNNF